jgi:hypothetical protein
MELLAVLVLAAALVGIGATFGSSDRNVEDPRRSSMNDSRRGLRALYLVLDEIGAKPHRQLKAPNAADPVDRTLVLASPSVPVTKRETSRIVDWVAAGGRLVIVGGRPPAGVPVPLESPVVAAFGLAGYSYHRLVGDEMTVHDEALREGLGRIEWPAESAIASGKLAPAAKAFEELVTSSGRCLAGRFAYGENGGEVVVVADACLLDNESLGREDNAVLAARLVAGRGAVVFDEFHHGYRDDGDGDRLTSVFAAMLFGTWPGRALLVVLFAGALRLAGAAVRLGAPLRDRPAPRRALSEHAEALGRIFEKAGARRETLAILAAGARRVTGPRAGIPASLAPAEFVRRLRLARAPAAAGLADALERADSPRTAKDVEMAEVAANLAAAKRRYLRG